MKISIFFSTLLFLHLITFSAAQCIFNTTHCHCHVSTDDPGLCTRYSSGTPEDATCFVDNCKANGYVCHCSGNELCSIRACDAWRADDLSAVDTYGELVDCTFHPQSAMCLDPPNTVPVQTPIPSTTPSCSPLQSPSPSQSSSPAPSSSTSPVPSESSSPTPSESSSPTPSESSSPIPSESSSPAPSESSSPAPSESSSPAPSESSSPAPSESSSPAPSESSSPAPSESSSPAPSESSSPAPSESSSPAPSESSSPAPSESSSPAPSESSSPAPSESSSPAPSESSSPAPSESSSPAPSESSSPAPSESSSPAPSESSSPAPSESSSPAPSQSSSPAPSESSSPAPSESSSPAPSESSSPAPSESSSPAPSESSSPAPSESSSPAPSESSSPAPSQSSSPSPSESSSPAPSESSSPAPSNSPSATPSNSPPPSATPSPSPIPEYRMFQFGDASDDSMFNMTMFTDTSDFITTTYDMRNRWPHKTRYEHRWHTIMLYKNNANTEFFLCYVINTYDAGDDGFGIMEMDVTISGDDGQIMQWVACDDPNDSCQTGPANSISSYFGNAAFVTDGFCIKPVDYSGNTFTISVSNVQRARGIRFIRPAQTVKEFLWSDGAVNGMTGAVDGNGLVTNGAAPPIKVNLAGLPVPMTP